MATRNLTEPHWSPSLVRPFLGRKCRLVVACRVCGGRHTYSGRLSPAPLDGEVVVAGVRYSVEDILAIDAEIEPARVSFALQRAMGLLGVLACYVSYLRLAHR